MKKRVLFATACLFSVATGYVQQTNNTNAPQENRRPKRVVTWVNKPDSAIKGVNHFVLASKALGHEVGYAVWTPADYDTQSSKRYPVLYFLHGAGGNEIMDAASFSGWLSKAIDQEHIPPVICVFPNGGMSGYRDSVERMIVNELVPLIDKKYRTLANPGSRVLAGFSMGGAGSVYLMVRHPDLFASASSMGGGIRMENDAIQDEIIKALPIWKKRNVGFFLVNGDKDRPDAFQQFAALLENEGISHQVHVLEDTNHNLGQYYERSVLKLLHFVGKHLEK